MTLNITDFKAGLQNITQEKELYVYVAEQLFNSSVIVVFVATLFIMLILGWLLVSRDKANFYAIFVLSALIYGILLFFTFWFPIIPQAIESIFGGSLF